MSDAGLRREDHLGTRAVIENTAMSLDMFKKRACCYYQLIAADYPHYPNVEDGYIWRQFGFLEQPLVSEDILSSLRIDVQCVPEAFH